MVSQRPASAENLACALGMHEHSTETDAVGAMLRIVHACDSRMQTSNAPQAYVRKLCPQHMFSCSCTVSWQLTIHGSIVHHKLHQQYHGTVTLPGVTLSCCSHAPASALPLPEVCVRLSLQPFFEAMHRAIRPGGVVCTQVSPPSFSRCLSIALPTRLVCAKGARQHSHQHPGKA